MSEQLLLTGLTQAALGTALALAVWLVTRLVRNPHLAAILWTLVLVKFLMPPLWTLPVAILAPPPPAAQGSAAAPVAAVSAIGVDAGDVDWPQRELRSDESRGAIPGVPAPSFDAIPPTVVESVPRDAAPTIAAGPIPARTPSTRWSAAGILLAVWAAGGLAYALFLLVNCVRFHRLVSGGPLVADDEDVRAAVARISARLNLRRPPAVRIVDARLSPLVWCGPGGTTLVLPRTLLSRLTPAQQDLLLAHELAHIRRGDHWLRWLEASAQVAWWWLPAIPWVRRHLHAAQEECCDAVVQRECGRCVADYCESLLLAAAWLTGVPSSPIPASELGRPSGLRKRIDVMLEHAPARPLSRIAVILLVALGLWGSALSIRWVVAQNPPPAAPEVTPAPSSPEAAPGPASSPEAADPPPAAPAVRPLENEFRSRPKTVEFVVTAEGQPVQEGKVTVSGRLDNGDDFYRELPLQNGVAKVELSADLATRMQLVFDGPTTLHYVRQFVPEQGQLHFPLENRYVIQTKVGIQIGGNVVDELGRPLSQVRVYLQTQSTGDEQTGSYSGGGVAHTDDQGRWSLAGVPDDLTGLSWRFEHLTHAIDPPMTTIHYSEKAPAEAYEPLRQLADVRVMKLVPPLAGQVVGDDGRQIPGVKLELTGRDSDWRLTVGKGQRFQTDDQGKFSLPAPPNGLQRLTLTHPDWMVQQLFLTIPHDGPLAVTMQKGRPLEFHVVDQDGQPIQGVTFNWGLGVERFDKTDANGRLVLGQLPERKFEFQIVKQGYLSQPPENTFGPMDSPVTVRLRKSMPVIGRVVDDETGAPIADYRVFTGSHFRSNEPDTWSWNQLRQQQGRPVAGSWAEGVVEPTRRIAVGQGAFHDEVRCLDRTYRYRVIAEGYEQSVSRILDATELPDGPVELEFRLKRRAPLVRGVVTPDGQPAAGAKVILLVREGAERAMVVLQDGMPRDSQPTATLIAGPTGEFEMPAYARPYVGFITHESGYRLLKDYDLLDETRIELTPWAELSGQMLRDGRPVAGVPVRLAPNSLLHSDIYHSDDPDTHPPILIQDTQLTDAEGRYRFARTIAGHHNLSWSFDPLPPEQPVDGATAMNRQDGGQANITLRPGERVTQDLGGADIVGRVIVPTDVQYDWERARVYLKFRSLPERLRGERFDHDYARQRTETLVQFNARITGDGTFRLRDAIPGDYLGSVYVPPVAEHSMFGAHKLTITRDQFSGKSSGNPIELGEFNYQPVAENDEW